MLLCRRLSVRIGDPRQGFHSSAGSLLLLVPSGLLHPLQDRKGSFSALLPVGRGTGFEEHPFSLPLYRRQPASVPSHAWPSLSVELEFPFFLPGLTSVK